jgi:hypothetical protein
MRLAEGVQAEAAAKGLADVKVREAGAVATEKQGLAEARVTLEKLEAQAKGEEAQGQARVRVREADAGAYEKQGLAEAKVLREKALAEASEVREKLLAEAAGIAEKAVSMKALDEASRTHEEFRLRLDKEKAIELEQVAAQIRVAEAQAQILAEAFKTAKIDIIGGDGQFFDRIVGAVGMGKAVDGFVRGSDTAQKVIQPYIDGESSLAADIKDVLTRPALSAEDLQSLTVSALIAKLMGRTDAAGRLKLQKLMESAKALGVDSLNVS